MCTENTEEYTYEYIVKAFGKEKIDARYEHIKKRMIHFIARTGATDIYLLNESILKDTITDYFADIKRLKEFQNIEHTNKNKITAYMAYWILRRKPIQVTIDDCKYEFLYPNEQFVASLIMKELLR